MERQYALLVLMLLYNQNIVSSHILTTNGDLSLPTCMRLLAFAVRELCAVYGDSSEEKYDAPYEYLRMLESRRNDMHHNNNIMKHCCMKPCSLPELMSIC